MDFDPLKVLSVRMRFKSAVLLPILAAYVVITVVIFFRAVIPSYDTDTTSWTFAVDSTQYVYMADSLREGRNEPWVLAAFATFPNTVITPVLIALVLNSAFLEMLFNFFVFAVSIILLKRVFPISPVMLLALLLLNPTTTTSLLCVNKEVLDLFCLSLFLYSQRKRSRGLLLLALGLALLNRYEFCIVILGFIVAQSRANPWRLRRLITLIFLVILLNFSVPLSGGHALAQRFEEAQYGGFIRALDLLQLNYMYALAVIPKIAENIFGQLVNLQVWREPTSWLYINFFNNLSYVVLTMIVFVKRQMRLRNDLIYFGAIGSVIIAQSLVVQPRYFYFLYALLCLQAAHREARGPAIAHLPQHQELVHA
jgi:hypothetical protein